MAMKLKSGDLAAAQSIYFNAARLMLKNDQGATHQRGVAAGKVEQGQPQGHQEQPAQRRATGWQNQAFPDGRPVSADSPLHQPGPRQCGASSYQKRYKGEAVFKAGQQSSDVGSGLPGHAGLKGDAHDPDGQSATREK